MSRLLPNAGVPGPGRTGPFHKLLPSASADLLCMLTIMETESPPQLSQRAFPERPMPDTEASLDMLPDGQMPRDKIIKLL